MGLAHNTPLVATGSRQDSRTARWAGTRRRIWRDRWLYALVLPGLIYFVLFHYIPLLGSVVAFQDYSPFLGFRDSPWVGWDNFRALFTDPAFSLALSNTLIISALQLVFAFPVPIALALLLHSIINQQAKRFMQSVLYLPYFLSWVIVVTLSIQIFGGAGFLNQALSQNGLATIDIMTNPDAFRPVVLLQGIWKDAGWGTIIFLAALTRIDFSLYEAAVLDGANGWNRLWTVTLPGIQPIIFLVLILNLGSILTTGFEQFYLQRGAFGVNAVEVLDTFTYFRGIRSGDYGFATAVGLTKGVVGAILIFGANWLSKRISGEGVF